LGASPSATGITLVLGGARSGKSRYAQKLIEALPPPWIYVATSQPHDAEMAARIAAHRAQRHEGWQTIEAPHDLPSALGDAPPQRPLLVDCMTLWLSNRMLANALLDAEIDALELALTRRGGALVLVSNEVGQGIVPDNALARRFRDLQGELNQRLALCAHRVVLMVAGMPLTVKASEKSA
jgi:adenosylcobinamide kinase / adenosylcobinamide-phosphate guanylyltransferase